MFYDSWLVCLTYSVFSTYICLFICLKDRISIHWVTPQTACNGCAKGGSQNLHPGSHVAGRGPGIWASFPWALCISRELNISQSNQQLNLLIVTLLLLCFKKYLFVYLFVWKSKLQRMGRKRNLVSTGFLPKWPQCQELLLSLRAGFRGLSALDHFHCLPRCINRGLIPQQSSPTQ